MPSKHLRPEDHLNFQSWTTPQKYSALDWRDELRSWFRHHVTDSTELHRFVLQLPSPLESASREEDPLEILKTRTTPV